MNTKPAQVVFKGHMPSSACDLGSASHLAHVPKQIRSPPSGPRFRYLAICIPYAVWGDGAAGSRPGT